MTRTEYYSTCSVLLLDTFFVICFGIVFVYLEMSLFPSIFCTISAFSLFVWTIEYVVRSFLPNDVFLPGDHGLDFLYQLM